MSHEEELEQDLSHIHWSWPEAIAANPARSLANSDLAMDYFAFSPFWDSKSNNNVLRTQRRVENPGYGHAEEKVELTAFRTGFEYIVAHARAPDVFVIHQRPVVRDGSRGPVSHAYFIIQDKIYMAPNLHDVAAMRLRNALHLVERTFDALERARPSANPRAGAAWRAIPKTEKEKNKDKKDGEGDEGAGGKDGDGDATMDEATGTPAAKGKDVSSNDKEADDIASVGSGSGSASASKQAGPDWHLFHALASTRAALGDLDALAAAPAPLYDTFAEARALEAAALASLGRVPQQPQQLQQQQQPQQQQLAGPGGGLGLTPAGTAAPTPLGRRMSTLAPSLAGESPVA